MPDQLLALHANTPDIAVNSLNGTVRALRFLREPGKENELARLLITHTTADPLIRTSRAFGARLLENVATGNADAVILTALAGQPLMLHTVDGDISLSFGDAAGRPLWGRNAQGTTSAVAYEANTGAGRPLATTEQPAGGVSRIREQYAYSPFSDASWKGKNLAGALSEHRDNAGISRPFGVSVTGLMLLSEQQLLKPEVGLPDWATTTEADTEEPLIVSGTSDATGAPLSATNAARITTVTAYNISGAVQDTRLRYTEKGEVKETVTLRDILYRADGVVLTQTAGNGITDTYEYHPRTQYLTRHTTQRPAGHPQGALIISDLHYTYDPAGNILTLDDKGADPDWHNNTEATGLRTYEYDTLYRLTSATGRERTLVSRSRTQSSDRADWTAGNAWIPYTEHYTYDDGDNLTVIRHTGGSGDRTRELTVAAGNNRAVVKDSGTTPETGFLDGGLQKQLADGRALTWHADNQLHQVNPVVRGDGTADDTECYHYADGGTRTRKIHCVQVSGGTQTTVTTYAGGCEFRQRLLSGQPHSQKHIVITESGGIRLVEDQLSGEIHLRYGFRDHLDSSSGETDGEGRITSREEYAPYGGTVGGDDDASEVSNLTQRTYRYSGKERDATGLLYYGWRYYQPEHGRWLSADPGGLVDGPNLFCFVRCRPIVYRDDDGLMMRSLGSFRRSRRPISRPTRVGGGEVSEEVAHLNEIFHRPREQENTDEERKEFNETIVNILKLHEAAKERAKEHAQSEDTQSKEVDLEQTLYEYAEGGSGNYQKVNNFLRGIEQSEDDNRSGEKLSKALGEIVHYLADYKKVAYRAVSVNKNVYSDKIRKGDIVKDKGYMSASINAFNSRKWAEDWVAGDYHNPEQEIIIFVFDNTVTKKIASSSILADHLIVSPELEFEVTDISLIPSLEQNEIQPLKIITLSSPIYADKYKIKNIHSGDTEEKVDHRNRVQKLKFWK